MAALVSGPIGMLSAAVSFAFVWFSTYTDKLAWLENPQDVFSSHGITALVGSICTGLFCYIPVNEATLTHNGLLYGGGVTMVLLDTAAVIIVSLYSIGMTLLLLYGLKRTLGVDGL